MIAMSKLHSKRIIKSFLVSTIHHIIKIFTNHINKNENYKSCNKTIREKDKIAFKCQYNTLGWGRQLSWMDALQNLKGEGNAHQVKVIRRKRKVMSYGLMKFFLTIISLRKSCCFMTLELWVWDAELVLQKSHECKTNLSPSMWY